MKSKWFPAALFILIYVSFLAYMLSTKDQLPERLATHFDAAGRPNDWMSRSGLITFTALFSLLVPMFVVGLMYVSRYLPASVVNMPNKEYWLAPERKAATDDWLFNHSWWLGTLLLCFILSIHLSILRVNKSPDPHLDISEGARVVVPFIVGLLAWIAVLLWRFFRLPRSQAEPTPPVS